MKRRGYIFSLFVFLMFVPILLLAVSNVKSVSVMQESNYEKIAMMKASRMIKNLDYYQVTFFENNSQESDDATCFLLKSALDNTQHFPLGVVVMCPGEVCPSNPPSRIQVSVASGYRHIIPIPGCS